MKIILNSRACEEGNLYSETLQISIKFVFVIRNSQQILLNFTVWLLSELSV